MDASPLIGDVKIQLDRFPNLSQQLLAFQSEAFRQLPDRRRFQLINDILFRLIQETPSPAFLLAAVSDYISHINAAKILKDHYHFSHFEFWLNSFAEANADQKYEVRAKIAGQYLPRDEYQLFFPIGMGNYFPGTHYVVAHLSPDIDTTVASFWGWLDAFSAQVSEGLHLWSLPGGPPESPVTQLFRDHFGPSIFSGFSRQAGTLTLNASDLVGMKNVVLAPGTVQANTLIHGFEEKAVLLVDDQGHYLGDWRSSDVESVRQILILFNLCLSWFETTVHSHLIALFAKSSLNSSEMQPFASDLFNITIGKTEPLNELTDPHRHLLEGFLIQILKISKGLEGTFSDLAKSLQEQEVQGLSLFYNRLIHLDASEIFDAGGTLVEDRPRIFGLLQQLINDLDQAAHFIRLHLERLDIAMQIKQKVLEKSLHFLTLRSDVEDIKIKMGNYSYLTVAYPETGGHLHPIGVIWAKDLRKSPLGTVSLRDFCNLDEVKMASYLSVISVVDHHKSSLTTITPPLAIIADAQSCNVLVAELAMELYDRYSSSGMSPETVNLHIEALINNPNLYQTHLLQQLLKRQIALETKGVYYVHPKREFIEYLYFIHAILDDTDLLTKVSSRDVYCVVHLLNRMKTLSSQKELEVITLDDLPKTPNFPHAAAKKILKNPDMYSIYKNIYLLKEAEVSKNIELCVHGLPSNLFLDTKEQNGCCRVGQTKLFASNYPLFDKHKAFLQNAWLKIAQNIYSSKPEIDFHLQMISTIASADDVYHESDIPQLHSDEFWFWLPQTEQAQNHLAIFLGSFQGSQDVKHQKMELEIRGEHATLWQELFYRNFTALNKEKTQILPSTENSMIILKFKAGSLNSRKSMISPYLPRLVP